MLGPAGASTSGTSASAEAGASGASASATLCVRVTLRVGALAVGRVLRASAGDLVDLLLDLAEEAAA